MSLRTRPNDPTRTILGIVIVILILVALWWLFLGNRGAGGPTGSPSPGASGAASESPSASAASESPSASAEASPSAATSPSGAAGGELAITARDFSFELSPSVATGAVAVTLTNRGAEEHQAQLARIADGKSLTDVVAAFQADEASAFALLTFSGGPTGGAPGSSVQASTTLKPGNYALLCFVRSPDGTPHIAKGMVAPLEVTEPSSGATLPSGDAEITMKDFAYETPGTLSAGAHVIAVSNLGPQPHEATVVRLNEGVTVDALRSAFASGQPAGPPPFTSAGGIAAIASNMDGTMNLDLTAGNYALICFVPDPASGKAHAELGMIEGFTVQ